MTTELQTKRTPRIISSKVKESHLVRQAVVYIRQSSPQQVTNHVESTARQCALVDRAIDLGWPRERVAVIDDDQGQGGQSSATRLGFQRLLAEVSLDHVGVIFGIEMSRLARSCWDWHQLLSCAASSVRCWPTPTACTIRRTTTTGYC